MADGVLHKKLSFCDIIYVIRLDIQEQNTNPYYISALLQPPHSAKGKDR